MTTLLTIKCWSGRSEAPFPRPPLYYVNKEDMVEGRKVGGEGAKLRFSSYLPPRPIFLVYVVK
jgi:hypothetical protein